MRTTRDHNTPPVCQVCEECGEIYDKTSVWYSCDLSSFKVVKLPTKDWLQFSLHKSRKFVMTYPKLFSSSWLNARVQYSQEKKSQF